MNNVKTPVKKDHKGIYGKQGTWVCRISYPDPITGKRKQTTKGGFETKVAAEKFARQRAVELDEGRTGSPGVYTVNDLFVQYAAAQQKKLEDGVIVQASYENMFNHWKKVETRWGDRNVADIKQQDVMALFKSIREEEPGHGQLRISRSYTNTIYGLANLVFAWGYRYSLVPRNIFDLVDRNEANPPENEKVTAQDLTRRKAGLRFFTADQAKTFLDAFDDPRLEAHTRFSTFSQSRDLLELLLRTGLRMGEAMGLTDDSIVWGVPGSDQEDTVLKIRSQWVKPSRGEVGTLDEYGDKLTGTFQERVKSKNGNREITISKAAEDVLKRVLNDRMEKQLEFGSEWRNPHNLIFMGDRKVKTCGYGDKRPDGSWGQVRKVSSVKCRMRSAASHEQTMKHFCIFAGLPHTSPHDLRHTFATLALQGGVQLAEVSKVLGHASVEITADTYLHLTPEMATTVSTAVDDLLN